MNFFTVIFSPFSLTKNHIVPYPIYNKNKTLSATALPLPSQPICASFSEPLALYSALKARDWRKHRRHTAHGK